MKDTEFQVSISDVDLQNGSPKIGDMIARNPKEHNDQWLVAKQYFEDNFEPVQQLESRIKELEGTIENNTTELEDWPYSSVIGQTMITKCCKTIITNENFCPNCGRKIVR